MPPDELARQSGRTNYIDRLRVLLTALVITHHTAITYGGAGSWFYREVTDSGLPGSQLLTLFCAVNQSFFMGMYFLVAGYFTPRSLQRKGTARFLIDRGIRLGVPLLAFGFLLGPLAVALASVPEEGASVLATWADLLGSGTFVMGPLWFAWALILFALAWVVWIRMTAGAALQRAALESPVPSGRAWLLSALAVGGVALTIRQWVPVGQNVLGLQLGYASSYVFLFFLGTHASSGHWFEQVRPEHARFWGVVSLVTIPILPLGAASAGTLAGHSVDFKGGLSAAAVLYAFWEPFVAWGIMAVLIVQFRQRCNTPGLWWKRRGDEAYGAFIIHTPLVVATSVLIAAWSIPPLMKFCLVAVTATVLSFMASRALRTLPGIDRIL